MVTGLFFWPYAYPALVGILGDKTLPNLKGRFLEGANGTVGQEKEAGLPNIKGTLEAYTGGGDSGIFSGASGAISVSDYRYGGAERNGSRIYRNCEAIFNAAKSSSIYGNSSTVQPASYTVNYLIKAY